MEEKQQVLLTHGDSITQLADGFKAVAHSGSCISGVLCLGVLCLGCVVLPVVFVFINSFQSKDFVVDTQAKQ